MWEVWEVVVQGCLIVGGNYIVILCHIVNVYIYIYIDFFFGKFFDLGFLRLTDRGMRLKSP